MFKYLSNYQIFINEADDIELGKDIEYRIVGVVLEKKKRYR